MFKYFWYCDAVSSPFFSARSFWYSDSDAAPMRVLKNLMYSLCEGNPRFFAIPSRYVVAIDGSSNGSKAFDSVVEAIFPVLVPRDLPIVTPENGEPGLRGVSITLIVDCSGGTQWSEHFNI
jgi:hypothetical protein